MRSGVSNAIETFDQFGYPELWAPCFGWSRPTRSPLPGERLRPRRASPGALLVKPTKERGLTQVQLAEAIGSSQRAVSYYENHASYPAADIVIALAGPLGVTTDELLGLRSPKRSVRAAAQEAESRRLRRRFQLVEDLPEKDQRAVLRCIHSLASRREAPRAAAR
jgi:transcriptional regulator with XRE-family HTH domain